MNRDKVKCYIYTRVSTALQVDGYALESGELVIAEDEELARIGGISLGNSTLSNVDLPLEKFPTHETVCLLSKLKDAK